MAENSKIEWTDHTFNPWWGCTRVSPACDHCYAETFSHRLGLDLWGDGGVRRPMSESYWKQPIRWNTKALAAGVRYRVFCASMADVFEHSAELDAWRTRLWQLVDATPQLDWLLLTKRPQNVVRMTPWGRDWPLNVWVGTTVENQAMARKRLKHLAKVPSVVRFVSCEPLLGPLDLSRELVSGVINWTIAGGESGPRSRPSAPDWFRSLRDQCVTAGVPFHFKQWGDWAPLDGIVPQHAYGVARVGKRSAGRTMDGKTWNGLPRVQSGTSPEARRVRAALMQH